MAENEEKYEEIEETEEEESQGVIDRIINVFLDPAALFRGLAKKPEFWTPVIIVVAVSALLTIATYPAQKEMRVEAKRAQWQLTVKEDDEEKRLEELADKEKQYVEKGQKTEPYYEAVGKVFVIVIYLVIAGVLYLISLIQGLDTSFKRIFSVVTYAALIGLLGGIIDQLLKLFNVVKPETYMEWQVSTTGLAFHISAKLHMAVYMLLNLVDPFVIWGFIVTAIGLKYANNCSTKAAIVTIVIYVIIVALLFVGLGFLTQMGIDKMAESGGGGVTVQVG